MDGLDGAGRGARRRVGGMEGILARRSQEYEAGRFYESCI